MNIDNIAGLTATLVRAGFEEGIGYRVLQRVCFAPGDFTMTERLDRNADSLVCHLQFMRSGGDYVCDYYDVSLIRGIVMPEQTVNGISLVGLDIEMSAIEWNAQENGKGFLIGDDTSWEREKKIEGIVGQLNKLSATQDGKYFADALKIKYWSSPGLEELVGNLASIRSRYEISQRVYFIDGEALSVDEAYRFLLNRWVVKKMQERKRAEGKNTQHDTTSKESPGKRLIKKNGRRGGSQLAQSIK